MKKFTLISIMLLVFLIIPINTSYAIPSLTDDEVWEKIHTNDPPLIIDVRSYEGYVEGHIPTSINIPLGNGVSQSIVDTINDYNRSEIITVCSCTDGANARAFGENLTNLGVLNMYYMYDNFLYWPFDVVKGSSPGTINIESSNQNGSTNDNQNFDPFFLIFDILLAVIIGVTLYKRKK